MAQCEVTEISILPTKFIVLIEFMIYDEFVAPNFIQSLII